MFDDYRENMVISLYDNDQCCHGISVGRPAESRFSHTKTSMMETEQNKIYL